MFPSLPPGGTAPGGHVILISVKFDETIAERVRPLVEAFHEAALVRLAVRDGEFELELRRARPAAPAHAATVPVGTSEPAARPVEVILADSVGVVRFLRPPVGDGMQVDGDRDLAFVETLGIRNPVRSRGAGRVASIFVTDAQPVEYGQPLFAIER
jgi:biotin carboxyl carrier protein